MARLKASVGIALGLIALTALPACSKKAADDDATASGNAAPAAAAPAAATVSATDTTTLDGTKLASFTGTAAAGEKVVVVCKTCHAFEAGKNMIGPSLHGIVGRHSGSVEGYTYSAANKGSGIVWTEDKLYQYLENPQRIVPGTKMTYTGVKDPQQRADVIAYLKSVS